MGLMEMTREEALKYHRQMWGDMLENLGDDATAEQRDVYKGKWLDEHFSGYKFRHNCILCTYVDKDPFNTYNCCYCPIDWEGLECPDEPDLCDGGRCWHEYKGGGKKDAIYLDAPISEILALPEREDK